MGKIIDSLKELIKEFIQPNNEGGSFEELALSSGLNEKDTYADYRRNDSLGPLGGRPGPTGQLGDTFTSGYGAAGYGAGDKRGIDIGQQQYPARGMEDNRFGHIRGF